ncbi:hypothetical protein CI610_02306 [invertebrate metagenome]|uniref:Uncharacterized protein n=1 Tax=invertebrate metagenome TaxID=1711999 RepID=A0A2H9T6B8_9ZZZZ
MFASGFHSLIICRCAAIGLAVLLGRYIPYPLYYFILTMLAFTHTLLALKSSSAEYPKLLSGSKTRWFFGFIVILALLSAFSGWPSIPLLFVIHHVLTEQYIYSYAKKEKAESVVFYLCLIMNTVVGFVFSGHVNTVIGSVVVMVCLLALLVYAILKQSWIYNKRRIAFEISQLCFVAWFLIGHVQIIDLLMYHFLFWAVYPVFRLSGKRYKSRMLMEQVACFFLLSCVSLVLYPLNSSAPRFIDVDPRQFFSLFHPTEPLFWIGSLHIVLSLALSRLNPRWINRLFSSIRT